LYLLPHRPHADAASLGVGGSCHDKKRVPVPVSTGQPHALAKGRAAASAK